MTDQNTNGNRPRSATGFIDMVVVGNAGSDPEMRFLFFGRRDEWTC
jgi:hypothetical protein